jgi:hypothetical protein
MRTDGTLWLPRAGWIVSAALALSACGGGGGGGAGGGGGNSPALQVSKSSIDVTSDTSTGGLVINNPVTFSVINPGTATFYFLVTYGGTAIRSMIVNGATSTTYSTQNPTIGNAPKLANTIGATIAGTMLGHGADGINEVVPVPPVIMGAGTYTDQITIEVCADPTCNTQINGSPQTVNVTYVVTGNPKPSGSVTVFTNLAVEAGSTQTTTVTGTVGLNASNLAPTGVFVTMTPSKNGIVSGTTFHSTLSSGINTAFGTITVTLQPPSSVGIGVHADSFQINTCFDAACAQPAPGSPWTVNVTYVVDPTAGSDYTQKTLALSLAGIA